ncbi:glyceraldehyde 3-phosphate dehydrogenase [Desulfonatronum thiosulfatophilum]|uniref:Glyceraldehyde-3-phosphate dehydrogenase n=1 Tax=Desulfonatronum thiosulfatophilum TaxID=617002 RepID=A0A1G6CKR3_9BACT|nr:type I glyceraldehyde-3-phosphate dehydrogenase [Desulfonatronum thiosulfatophilum]SDB33459.1 glyceraldehyde 3-phosphate dehydrogenase [Desulfonatronum thiosulfatophilum]
MTLRIGLNGFGRIGKNFARLVMQDPDVELVAFNARKSPSTYAYTFKYDSVHGNWPGEVGADDDGIIIDGKKIKMTKAGKGEWQWGDLGVDLVVEATGMFVDRESCQMHLDRGAKKVIISAPGKKPDLTVVYNVNHEQYDPSQHSIISVASCTTNCLAPVVQALHKEFTVAKGFMTTVHAYTTSQAILDSTNTKDPRRGRAAAINILPTSTGAARMVGQVLPEMEGKIDGLAIRSPNPNGSIVDLTAVVEKRTSTDEVNEAFRRLQSETLGYTDEYIVSSDIVGDTHGCVIDGRSTAVIQENLVKVLAWYDNEMGFNNQMLRMVKYVGSKL